MNVTVLIPVLNRPQRAQPVIDSLRASERDITLSPLFLCSPRDGRQRRAVESTDAPFHVMGHVAGRADYSKKMNWGARRAVADGADFVFFGADDLTFHPGWADVAVEHAEKTDCCVIGTNDLGNSRVTSGKHSTHSLVHRDYLKCGSIDDRTVLLHEGYWHNFVDDEFVGTARWRNTFSMALNARVEHLHPNWGKAEDDSTYRKGQEQWSADRVLYLRRRPMWGGL